MTRRDGMSAMGLYVCVMGLACLLAWLLAGGGEILVTSSQCIIAQYLFAAADALLVFIFLAAGKKSWKSIGLTTEGLRRALLFGCIAGLLITAFNLTSAYLDGAKHLNSLSEILRMMVMFLFFAIPEELVFRGYLQTNLKGLVKNVYLAELLGAVLFMGMHLPMKLIPVMMYGEMGSHFDFMAENLLWAVNLIVVALIYSYVRRKTGSLAAPLAAHVIVNLSYSLLIR